MRRAPLLLLVALGALGGCGSGDAANARSFTEDALRATGLTSVEVAAATQDCDVEGVDGIRTTAATDVGEVSLCVSVDRGRALSVRDPGLSDQQFRRLDRYRGETAQDRARPAAVASAGLLLVGVLILLLLRLRPPRDRPS